MPVTVSAVKRVQPGRPSSGASSASSTGNPFSVGASVAMSAGSAKIWPLSIANSRAMPRMLSW